MHSKASPLTPGCSEGQFSIYCRASNKESRQLMLKRPRLSDGFQGQTFKGRVREVGDRMWDQLVYSLLIGWWWDRKLMSSTFWFQPVWGLRACGQHAVNLLSPPGSFHVCKAAQRYCYVYPLRGNQDPTPRLHYCLLIAPQTPSLPWLATVWTRPLEHREGHRGGMKPISCKQKNVWGVRGRGALWAQKDSCAQEPYKVLLSFTIHKALWIDLRIWIAETWLFTSDSLPDLQGSEELSRKS